jgi:hypothetical protein
VEGGSRRGSLDDASVRREMSSSHVEHAGVGWRHLARSYQWGLLGGVLKHVW